MLWLLTLHQWSVEELAMESGTPRLSFGGFTKTTPSGTKLNRQQLRLQRLKVMLLMLSLVVSGPRRCAVLVKRRSAPHAGAEDVDPVKAALPVCTYPHLSEQELQGTTFPRHRWALDHHTHAVEHRVLSGACPLHCTALHCPLALDSAPVPTLPW